MNNYDITDEHENVNPEIDQWLEDNLDSKQYVITNRGFLIDSYCLSFKDPVAETMYLLRWT